MQDGGCVAVDVGCIVVVSAATTTRVVVVVVVDVISGSGYKSIATNQTVGCNNFIGRK